MKLHLVYFSPTGSTRAALQHIARGFVQTMPQCEINEIDCTLPKARQQARKFTATDTVILGMPVYYGRIPALFHEMTQWQGQGAKAAYVVVYGDRAYEDALLELQKVAEKQGFVSVGAAAFIAEHSLNPHMGEGRPNAGDLEAQEAFGGNVARRLAALAGENPLPLKVKGNAPYKAYGSSPFIPQTDANLCTACGLCAASCPTGCIDQKTFATTAEACIACRACIKYCPAEARLLPAPLAKVFAERMVMLRASCPGGNEPEIFGL